MKTTVDVDRDTADEAAEILGTSSLKDTVNAALGEVVAAARRRRLAEMVRRGGVPVPTPAELRRLRAPTIPRGSLGGKRPKRR